MRDLILKYVGKDEHRDLMVRDVAIKFKRDSNKSKQKQPFSPIVHVLNGSTPIKRRTRGNRSFSIFGTQSQDDPDEHEKSIAEEFDEIGEIHGDLRRQPHESDEDDDDDNDDESFD